MDDAVERLWQVRVSRPLLLAVLAGVFAPVGAAATLAELPPEAQVREALGLSPRLQVAVESIARSNAVEQRLAAGPHEWELQATNQLRKDSLGVTHAEQEYGLQKGLRWPGKYSLDRQLGTQARNTGELSYLDAWHEAGRDLLDLWFSWVGAEELLRLNQRQQQIAQEQLTAIARRVAAGDAAALDQQLADAELQRLRAAGSQARREAQLAAAALSREFPALQQIRPDLRADPAELPGTDAEWYEQITGDNHELELARSRRDEARLNADRTARNRLADPTIGLRFSGNADDDRHVIGLTITLPLGGAGRTADTAIARSDARRADATARQAEDMVAADARAAIADARQSLESWRYQLAALRMQQSASDAVAKGYAAGEFDIGVLLAARRAALDAEERLLEARIAASHSHARVLLDAHHIWKPDNE